MAARRRQTTTAQLMGPLVAAWRRGQGTQAQIAAQAGMPSSTFAWWCQRLGRRPGKLRGGFVAVDVGPERCESATAGEPLEVVLAGGAVVRVPSGFDGETLERLLTALARRAC